MRRLVQLLLSPPSRFARLLIAEKRLACDWTAPEDLGEHLPLFVELDGSRYHGLWAIVDQLEGSYPDHPLTPEEPQPRAESLRLLDWAIGPFLENVTRRIVYERASQRYTGSTAQRAPDMQVVRAGREALRTALSEIGAMAERNGCLASRNCSLGDLAVAANLSAIDYLGEVPWNEFPGAAEWYMRIKSRPSFRTLLADRVPGQPPAPHYPDLDA
ncbi:MAG TPA: glutathione S-transferase family protein [Rhizomicrobium sp.]|jgi:glutathione S-transferase|nr:glutathione S-transferase family protein [Rhizomicrobium sp.]